MNNLLVGLAIVLVLSLGLNIALIWAPQEQAKRQQMKDVIYIYNEMPETMRWIVENYDKLKYFKVVSDNTIEYEYKRNWEEK